MHRNYFNYFTEIEEYFTRKRGKNLLVSPLDWCLIELWKENGVPLHIVLRGIDRSFESAAKRAKKPPTTLHYCHPAVMEAFEEYQEGAVGSHPEEEPSEEAGLPRERVLAFIEDLHRQIVDRPEDPSKRAAKRLEALAAEVGQAHSVRLEALDLELTGIRRTLVGELSEGLEAERLKEVHKEARRETRAYRKRLSAEMYDCLLEKHLESKLGELFDLPEFSLIHLE